MSVAFYVFTSLSILLLITNILVLCLALKIGCDVDNNKRFLECGEIINTATGRLSYKLGESFLPNERCVWIVRPMEKTGGFTVSVDQMGFGTSNEDHGLMVVPYDVAIGTPPQYIANDVGTIHLNGSFLLITFYSGPDTNSDNRTGFTLRWISREEGAFEYPSLASHDHIITDQSGEIPRSIFDSREMSTFLFTTTTPGIETIVDVEIGKMCFSSYYHVFKFKSSAWDRGTLHCAQPGFTIKHNDTLIFVLQGGAIVDEAWYRMSYFRYSKKMDEFG